MKDLIKQALDDAVVYSESNIPQTKKEYIKVNIEDVMPIELLQFMKDNDIPDTAQFLSYEDDAFMSNTEVYLSYTIDVPTTEQDKFAYKIKKFNNISFKLVYDNLTQNGYKRVGCWSNLFEEFNDTTVYDMYINNDFDRLVKYYSLSFQKED